MSRKQSKWRPPPLFFLSPPGSLPSLSCSTDVQPDDIGPPVALGIGVGRGRRIVALHILSLREKVRYDCSRASYPRARRLSSRAQNLRPFSAGASLGLLEERGEVGRRASRDRELERGELPLVRRWWRKSAPRADPLRQRHRRLVGSDLSIPLNLLL